MKNNHEKIERCTYLLLSFLVLTLLSIHTVISATQKTFKLDLDVPLFMYEEYELNETTTKNIIYNTSENITLVSTVSKNSAILDSGMILTGKITPSQTTGTGVSYHNVAVGNVTGRSKLDIAIGTSTSPHVYLFNSSLDQKWNFTTIGSGVVYSLAIGNVTSDSMEEVAFGSEDTRVYLLNSSGDQIWDYYTSNEVRGVDIGEITSDPGDEIVAGTLGSDVYVLNSTGQEVQTLSTDGPVYSVAIGDITTDINNEIAVGDNYRIYVFNSTGYQVWNLTIGNIIRSIAIGEILSDTGNEIIAGTNNGTLYVVNSTASIRWTRDINDIYSVVTGDITSDTGNEIAVGSGDYKVYVINSTGSEVWTFTTGNEVHGVAIGEITTDPLNETVAVSLDKNLYILNFEYYPTPYLDVGADGDWDWNYPEKLRGSVNVTNSSIAPEIQDYLSSCTPDVNGTCDIPFIFYSASTGELEISNINITYDYNASSAISYQHQTDTWSRTNNIVVNETVGNEVDNISYGNPTNAITINYIKINETATNCDFNGNSYSNTTINGINYCNIGSDSVVSGELRLLWDNSMSASMPVILNESSEITTPDGIWKKNVTVWSNTTTTFTNITANTTLNYSIVISDQGLYVDWYSNGTFYDITPSTTCPTYDSIQIGDDVFSVCKEDKFGSDGVVDFFEWVQPHTSTILYEVKGSVNTPANLTNLNVTPSSGIWGEEYNFTVNVSDSEGDNVTVNLWVYLNSSNTWVMMGQKNTTILTNETPEIIKFNVISNKSWTGTDKFRFEYRDFSGGYVYHDWQFTNESTGPYVSRHSVSIIYVQGNNTIVNRTGNSNITLIIGVNDTDNATMVESNVNCGLWLTIDGSNFTLIHTTTTNSSGYCNYTFDPNSSYYIGKQWWVGGTYQDSYYLSQNSTNFTLEIYGQFNINLTESFIDKNFTRSQDVILTAKIYDDRGYVIPESGHNCTWYINNETGSIVETGNSTTNTTGYCNYTWTTGCSNDLGIYNINVTLLDSSNYYYIGKDSSETNITLKDDLDITIIFPNENFIIHEQEKLNLNSTLSDSCGSPTKSYSIKWFFIGIGTCSGEVGSGGNTTYNLDPSCTPRSQTILANVSGNLYNIDKDNVSIYIYGWSRIDMITPTYGSNINRSEVGGLIEIICFVDDANASVLAIEEYPVNFWYKNQTSSNYMKIGTNLTNTSIGPGGGYAKIFWNLTVPDGNYTLKCNITDNSTLLYNTSIPEDVSDNVKVFGNPDIIPPTFLYVNAYSAELYDNVTIEARIKDFYSVDKVWLNITFPNTSTFVFNMKNTSSDLSDSIWNASLNLTEIWDYDFVIYANDTSNNTNSTTGWFEVYLPLKFLGNTVDANGNNVSVKFIFYKNGTKQIIHQFSTNASVSEYNFTIHKRIYDLVTKVFDHTIKFYNVNSTATAEQQFMTSDVTNITNPLNFTEILPASINPPKAINKLKALEIKTILVNENVTITLNYSSTYSLIDYEPAVEIFRCSNWTHPATCNSGWEELGGVYNSNLHTISLNLTNTSVYAAVEAAICGNGVCQDYEHCGESYYCAADCGECPTGDEDGGGGRGGGGGGIKPRCGNGVCEAGENVYNCPRDCGQAETMFSLKTNLTNVQLEPGEEGTYALWVTNNVKYTINASISIIGEANQFIIPDKTKLKVNESTEKLVKLYVRIPSEAEAGVYTGDITVSADGKTESIPVSITVSAKGATYLDVVVEALTKRVGINDTAKFHIMLYNLGFRKKFNVTLDYSIKDFKAEGVIHKESEIRSIQTSESFVKNIPLSEINITEGQYLIEVQVKYDSRFVTATDDFEVVLSFWTSERITQMALVISVTTSIIAVIIGRRKYIAWKQAKARYIFPIDMDKLPKGEIWLGKIAETRDKTYFSMDDLTTHVLTAGATGAGKSVSAMVFVEDLLDQKIPVVVFDPTAQWTGFVRPCKDPKLLKYYRDFGMNVRDSRPYRGMIYEVTDPNIKIDFKKYMNPGEITVFTLNKLEPGQYDDAVVNIINTIFAQGWEESTRLKMIIVFDEVHRLLEKYGGKGGYVSLEKACREFRKWGIGLIMASQVLSDFKEAIKGNVLTEVQLHTKSLADLGRVEKKYGLEYAKKVTKLEVGVGMMQNPKYNEGRPWFVAFRPTLHSPHKIPDVEMNTYREYAALLNMIETKIDGLEKSGTDVFDLRTELKLAKDKLKKGRFRMAKIYIDSLNKHLSSG